MLSNARLNFALVVVVASMLGCADPVDPSKGLASSRLAVEGGPGAHADDGSGHHHQPPAAVTLNATLIASGISGAGAIAEAGEYHRGNPVHEVAALRAMTEPGQVLDQSRLLVASSSNYGAPLARAGENPGSILSIQPAAAPVAVPAGFASAGTQVSAQGGALILFTAQSPNFLNSVYAPAAVTANYPAVSLPLGISINNGGGRPWFANGPVGSNGGGTITVIDPDGRPLKGGPSPVANGVFEGNQTNRAGNATLGLTSAAVGTALLTRSPDKSGRAVFAATLADGSVRQVHVQLGVSPLAPAGTITPLPGIDVNSVDSTDPTIATRAGMAFNWAPERILYVADPYGNRIAALHLSDDGVMFSTNTQYLYASEFNLPVDVAATSVEVEADLFSSNSTLGAGSDLYVLNRGNNTIVRVTQAGKVLAVASLSAPVSGYRVNGLAVSADGRRIWVTATLPNHDGVVLSVPAFGAGENMDQLMADATAAGAITPSQLGAHFFSHPFAVDEGVGPLFNGQACASCHNSPVVGGMGTTADTLDFRVGRIRHGDFVQLPSGPVTRAHSVSEIGGICRAPTGIPENATVVSTRSTMTLRGTALIDDIDQWRIVANMDTQPAAVRGHPNWLPDGRVGRFGWKAQIPTLVEFMGDAFRNEMGITNPLLEKDLIDACGANRGGRDVDAAPLVMTAKFLNGIDPPVPTAACLASPGAAKFSALGCASCHTPSFPGPARTINLYSDLLLHDMGPGLADEVVQESAGGSDFRTMPLWKLSERSAFLHDGRASNVTDAITAHGGQAAPAAQAYQALTSTEKQEVLDFLNCI